MDVLKKTNEWRFMLMLIYLVLIFSFHGVGNGAEVPTPEDVAFGKAPLPTIEELTGGKVKEGDLIDKNNMDLVRDVLTEGQIKCLQAGMVMRMANHKLKPLEGTPIGYNELTEKNRGKAVLASDAITVFYGKEGTLWPGGCPFPEPKIAEEVMVPIPAVLSIKRNYEEIRLFYLFQGRLTISLTRYSITQRSGQSVQD